MLFACLVCHSTLVLYFTTADVGQSVVRRASHMHLGLQLSWFVMYGV